MSKYGNKKTVRMVNNELITFHSLKEARRYDNLLALAQHGKITELTLQPKYDLIPTIKHNGETLRKITYSADFRYVENGKLIVEDVKASSKFQDPVYKLKKRLLLTKYAGEFEFREVYRA